MENLEMKLIQKFNTVCYGPLCNAEIICSRISGIGRMMMTMMMMMMMMIVIKNQINHHLAELLCLGYLVCMQFL